MLKFVKPEWTYKNRYIEMMGKWHKEGGMISPWPITLAYDADESFEKNVKHLNKVSNFVPSTTYWLYDDETDILIGAVNIRHYLGR